MLTVREKLISQGNGGTVSSVRQDKEHVLKKPRVELYLHQKECQKW